MRTHFFPHRFFLCALIVLAGCSKDPATPHDPASVSYGLLPAQGHYTYTVHGTDGTNGSETIDVSPRRDSAGGHAVTMIANIESFHDTSTVFTNATETLFPLTKLREWDSIAQVFRSMPGVVEFNYGGWPVWQHMPNTAAVNDPVSFTGGPIHMHWVIVDNSGTSTGDFLMNYLPGKVIASNVPVTTPAGTFPCSVWAFSRRIQIQAGGVSQIQTAADTLWMSPNLPFVKSTELLNNIYSVTQLQQVQ